MIKCQNCGTYVPAEKAFCPNCSEPMEMEEKSNRSHSFSSDMMSTIRDDPEKYREMLNKLPSKKKPEQTASTPQPEAPPQLSVNAPPLPGGNAGRQAAPQPAPTPPAAVNNQWQAAPQLP